MKIGIFGTGSVGRTLAAKLTSLGNEVMIGTRNVQNTMAKTDPDILGTPPYKEWQAANPNIKLATFSQVADFGEVIILSTFGDATKHALDLAGKEKFTVKTVIDMTNPLDVSGGTPPKFTGAIGNSLGEQIQRHIPQANVVKAFNSTSVHVVVNPQREEGEPTMFIAGNDNDAKKRVAEIAQSIGWKDIIDFGDISESFWLETLGLTWIYYAFKNQSWSHAFKLYRK